MTTQGSMIRRMRMNGSNMEVSDEVPFNLFFSMLFKYHNELLYVLPYPLNDKFFRFCTGLP